MNCFTVVRAQVAGGSNPLSPMLINAIAFPASRIPISLFEQRRGPVAQMDRATVS